MDYRKAYDLVVRDNLWFKLIRYGTTGNMLDIIKYMYTCVRSKLSHNNQVRDNLYSTIGVAQFDCM